MKIPVIHGVIKRRILANYQVDPDVLQRILPPPFRPKLINGVGIAGICLIRLERVRPQFIGSAAGAWGIASENAAHRIAVEWQENGQLREGVFIPRRDTSSRLNYLAGGRVFPGMHHHAHFDVDDGHDHGHYRVAFQSDDGLVRVWVEGHVDQALPATSVFGSLQAASAFFEGGALGYSVTKVAGQYDGLELRSFEWKVEPLTVERSQSSFFEDERQFLKGALRFDCALLMRDIQHEWHGQAPLCCALPN